MYDVTNRGRDEGRLVVTAWGVRWALRETTKWPSGFQPGVHRLLFRTEGRNPLFVVQPEIL